MLFSIQNIGQKFNYHQKKNSHKLQLGTSRGIILYVGMGHLAIFTRMKKI